VRRYGAAAALLLALFAARGEVPHAHGVARLDVAIEGRRVSMELAAPLEDVLGFERRPANDKERTAFEAASSYLKSGRGLVPGAAANCRVADGAVAIEQRGPGHFELVARLAYDCKEPHELKEIDAALLGQYKRLKRLDVRVVGPKGQAAARATPAKSTFPL
jgi:hypothetical protein